MLRRLTLVVMTDFAAQRHPAIDDISADPAPGNELVRVEGGRCGEGEFGVGDCIPEGTDTQLVVDADDTADQMDVVGRTGRFEVRRYEPVKVTFPSLADTTMQVSSS